MSAVSAPKSEAQPPVTFPPLELVPNDALGTIVKAINAGNIVALLITGDWRVVHNLKSVDLSEKRVVYADCNLLTSLIIKSEWDDVRAKIPTMIEMPEGDLRSRIIEQKTVPHKAHLTNRIIE